MLSSLSLAEGVGVPEGRWGRLLTGNDRFISGKTQRRDVRCRAGLGCGWGRASERPRLRFPPAAWKEEGAAVPVEGKFLGGGWSGAPGAEERKAAGQEAAGPWRPPLPHRARAGPPSADTAAAGAPPPLWFASAAAAAVGAGRAWRARGDSGGARPPGPDGNIPAGNKPAPGASSSGSRLLLLPEPPPLCRDRGVRSGALQGGSRKMQEGGIDPHPEQNYSVMVLFSSLLVREGKSLSRITNTAKHQKCRCFGMPGTGRKRWAGSST